ncbi:TPA: helix-turn-helix domain-containing protein [Escherichia coli]|nr:helix-turn-helix domain-containing protein [Escherichia coli]
MKRVSLKQVRESYSGIEPGKNGVNRSFIDVSRLYNRRSEWSETETRALICLVSNKVSYKDIAVFLGRSRSSVANKARSLSLKNNSFYSPEEDRIIRLYAGKKSVSEIASILGRGYAGVKDYCFRRRILMRCYSVYHHNSKLSDDDICLIFSLREEGLSIREIALKFDVSPYHVRNICAFNKRVTDYYSESERYKYKLFRRILL